MIQENDQISFERALLIAVAQEYLEELLSTANSPGCLLKVRRMQATIKLAKERERMSKEISMQFSAFAYQLGTTAGTIVRALGNDEVLAELVSRGCSRKDLQELLEATQKVAGAFYNNPQPA